MLTHLSVLEDKESGITLGPVRQNNTVHLCSILTLSKVESCKQRV